MTHPYKPVWQQQSPIDITPETTVSARVPWGYLKLDYPNDALHGHFCQHNFWFDTPPPMSMDGRVAKLVRLHIHSPAEHTIRGHAHPFEIHFVNEFLDQSGESKAVVLGVFFKEEAGAPTPAGIRALDQMLRGQAITERTPGEINPWSFIPSDYNTFFRYEGSLTTDPYDQVVNWIVTPSVVIVDPEDVKALKEHAEEEARPVQKIERRFILRNFL